MFRTTKRKQNAPSSAIQRRLLNVEIVEAREIIGINKANGGKMVSDPYVTLSLQDLAQRDIKAETFKSSGKSSTTNPIWNEKFTFGKNYDLDRLEGLPSLAVSIYHKGAFSVSETPLGIVHIFMDGLTGIDPSGNLVDLWYPIEMVGRMTSVSGQIRLKLSFTGPPSQSLDDDDDEEGGGGGANANTTLNDEEEEQYKDKDPNELVIHVVQGRSLTPADKGLNLFSSGSGTSDPLVRFSLKGFSDQETPYIAKTLSPYWDHTVKFPKCHEPSVSITATVEDYNTLSGRSFLGKLVIPLGDFQDKKLVKKWYKLRNAKNENDGTDRGEIELEILWRYSLNVDKSEKRKKDKFDNSILGKADAFGKNFGKNIGGALGIQGDSDSEVDEGGNEADNEQAAAAPTEAEKEEKKKAEEQIKKDLTDIDIKAGDYQVQVHIIEARDLKAENLDGTSDPIAYIECFGQKQNTRTIYAVTTCVFDELMIFNMKGLEKEQFEEGTIRIAVYDANSNPLQKNTMIGAYAFDAMQVYCSNKDHEMYRKWVPLMDDEDADDVGVQGYLKISVSIIGPGDKLKVHDEATELAAEQAKETAAGGDIGSLVLTTPVITRSWQYVVVTVYRCESLPVMDGRVGGAVVTVANAKTDAYCQVTFAGGKPIKTRVKTIEGDTRDAINPIFNYELWYPISIPTMTEMIKFSVWDWDPEKNELIGCVTEKYSKITRTQRSSTDIRWYNMYGAPEFKTDGALKTLAKGADFLAKSAAQTAGIATDYYSLYNNVPDKASAFKGRALLKFRIETKRPEKYDTKEIVPFRRKLARLDKKFEPPSADYMLQALVVCGTELPSFTQAGIGAVAAKKQDLQIKIAIGHHEIITKKCKWDKGLCRWNEIIKCNAPIKLPKDLSQIPDIFIYLVKEDQTPVCFARVKTVDLKDGGSCIGFTSPAEWHLLQEDKVVDALYDGDFPGNVLIKLGFGLLADAKASAMDWSETLDKVRNATPHQVRVHIYQGKNLPAADSNGLTDPFVVVNFMGQTQQTAVVKSTLFPAYYQTLVFNEITIPAADNYSYASMVNFRLFDKDDFNPSEYLGTFGYNLQCAVRTEDPDAPLPDPSWFDFFKEVPNDGEGSLLVLVQLIPGLPGSEVLQRPPKSIIPETRNAFIEIIAVGCRDMSPYNFLPMQAPFLEIEMDSFGSRYISGTQSSKKPNPSNPNFLERLVLPVRLPEKSLYAPPLQLRAKDTRLGGYLKPIVGVGTIDISTKIPWCLDTYVAPQSQMFSSQDAEDFSKEIDGLLPGENKDAVAIKTNELMRTRQGEKLGDDFIVSQAPPELGTFVKDRQKLEDTGAGVFGALHHINVTGEKKKTGAEAAFSDLDWSQDDGDQPPAWSINRRVLESELETELKTAPFETYALMRGKKSGMVGSTLKVVGIFKGLIRVMLEENEPPLFPKELMDELLKPKKYKIRLYALKAVGLTPMDYDIFGKPAKSDPYIKVKLGKLKFNDREHAVNDVTDVDLYKVIEFDAELPGTSQLQIEIMDQDDFGSYSDDLIGKTCIDLEDRWFDSRWQELGQENIRLPGAVGADGKPGSQEQARWCTKPIERRSLYVPSNKAPQGVLECWVDIMRPEAAAAFPPDDVSLPPKQMFEVRVVIWKSKDVPPQDSFEGMSDLFVKCWPEGCDKQETDTHWRCKKGKASWNWRLLFDVELGHNTRAMKFPYLHLQLWDRDLLKWSDCAGEGTFDLGPYYRKAYKRNIAIKLFEKKQGVAAKRAAKDVKYKKNLKLVDDGADIPPNEDDDNDQNINNTQSSGVEISESKTGETNVPFGNAAARDVDSDDDEDVSANKGNHSKESKAARRISSSPFAAGGGSGSSSSINKGTAAPRRISSLGGNDVELTKTNKNDGANNTATDTSTTTTSKKGFFSWFTTKKSDDEDGSNDPLLQDNLNDEEKKKEEEDDDAKEMVSTIKQMTGLYDEDPPDSMWYHLEKADHNGGKPEPMGSISFSVQIWPKDKAFAMPAGAARNDPNTNPFLPPPVGRLKWSWNPFVLGSELCGPKLCAYFTCCLMCSAFILLMIFCQPFLNIIINILFLG